MKKKRKGTLEELRWALFLVVATGLVILVSLFGQSLAWAGPSKITILHTNNVTGHLFGCPT